MSTIVCRSPAAARDMALLRTAAANVMFTSPQESRYTRGVFDDYANLFCPHRASRCYIERPAFMSARAEESDIRGTRAALRRYDECRSDTRCELIAADAHARNPGVLRAQQRMSEG
jgi:hypothetical protein